MARRYLEDFRPGEVHELGSFTLSKEEIIAFGRRYDPQPFHTDEEAAAHSPFGGLIASGWHTASACMRLVVEGLVNHTHTLGSPGIDELRWLKPVRPGDRLSVRVEIIEVRPSRSRPDRGTIKACYQAVNQRDEPVMTMIGIGMLMRRPSG
jgi:acyl dehydratase